jgi:uncharacterized protein YjbI with pentapeptide repeats
MKHLNVFLTIVSTGLFVFIGIVLMQHTTTISAQTPTTAPEDTTIPAFCVSCSLDKIGNRLKGKDLTNAYMSHSTFGNDDTLADLRGTIFNNAILDGAQFFGLLSHMKFKNASMIGSVIQPKNTIATDMNFKNADLTQSGIHGPIQNSNFSSANLTLVGIGGSGSIENMINCDFTDANMTDMATNTMNFTGSNMTGVTAIRSGFYNDDLTNVNFTNANLTNAGSMSTANVTGVIWSNTTCPDGTNSNNNGNTCVGHF